MLTVPETISRNITTAITTMIDKLEAKRPAAEVIKRSPLQKGIFHMARFIYKNGDIHLYTSEMDYGGPDLAYEGIRMDNAPADAAAVAELTPMLHQLLEKAIAKYDTHPILHFYFKVTGTFITPAGEVEMAPFLHISEEKRQQVIAAVDKYVAQKIHNGQYPTKELDTFMLANHLLNPLLRGDIAVAEVTGIFDKIIALNRHNKEALHVHRHNITNTLTSWAEEEFLPRYYTVVKDEYRLPQYTLRPGHPAAPADQLELLLYTAAQIIRYSPSYSRPTGIRFAEMAKELGSKQAATMLESGSGKFAPLTTPAVAVKVNDTFAKVDVHIKEESDTAYGQALAYLAELLEQGFPRSYSIQLKSKIKQLLPVRQLGKNTTQRFFANALQYPSLYPLLEKYARVAMAEEFEWYEDAEAEFCCLPGSYAVFGLGLAGEEWFPLVRDYLKQVDEEHQSVQYYFALALAEQHGITPTTIPVLVDCLRISPYEKPAKQLADLQRPEHLQVLLEELKGLEKYQAQQVIAHIWGSHDKLNMQAKKKGAPEALAALAAL